MKTHGTEKGSVLLGALLVGVMLAMLGGVAMNLAVTEATAAAHQVEEKSGLLLAESGVEQVVAWLTHGDLPMPGGAPMPALCIGSADLPDVEYDAARPDDERLLNDPGADGARPSADRGRIVRTRLYGSGLPDGFCTIEVTAESPRGVRRTVALEVGATRIPPLQEAVLTGRPSPWDYQRMKALAMRFGTYYVLDSEGRLYKHGTMDPSAALTPAEVVGSSAVGHQRGLVFIDTLDQQPPTETNLATLVLDAPYMEGTFYVNAHVVLRPDVTGRVDGRAFVQGVLHTAGTLHVEQPTGVHGAVVAERGLTGEGLLAVRYNADLGRGRLHGLPVVFPIRGSWREW